MNGPVKLTPAQVSAIECADLSDSPRLALAWAGNRLKVGPLDREAAEELAREINELSNSEDAHAQEMRTRSPGCAAGARGAALALANLYLKVLKVNA